MSKIKNSRLDQYGAEPFEQQRFGTAGAEGVKWWLISAGNGGMSDYHIWLLLIINVAREFDTGL